MPVPFKPIKGAVSRLAKKKAKQGIKRTGRKAPMQSPKGYAKKVRSETKAGNKANKTGKAAKNQPRAVRKVRKATEVFERKYGG